MSEIISHDADQPAVDRGEQLRLAIESGNVQDALKTSFHLLENNKMSKADLFMVMLMCLPDDIEGAKGEWNEAKLNGDVGEMVKVLLTRTEWWKIIKDSKNGSADLDKIINRFNEIVQANLSQKDEEIRKANKQYLELSSHIQSLTEQLHRALLPNARLMKVDGKKSKIYTFDDPYRNARNADDENDANLAQMNEHIGRLNAEIAEKDELIAQYRITLDEARRTIDVALELEKTLREHINNGNNGLAQLAAGEPPETVDHTHLINERDAEIAELKLQLEKLQAEIEAARQLAIETINENNKIDANRADLTTKHVEGDSKLTAEAKSDIQTEVDTFIARGNVENPNYSDQQKLFVGVYRDYQHTMKIKSTEPIPSEGEYYDAAMGFARKVTESSDNNVRGQELNNLKDKVREMISQSIQHANNVAARAGETSTAVFEKRDGANGVSDKVATNADQVLGQGETEKSDIQNTIDILIARGNQEVPNEPKWKQLFVGVYRNIYLLTDGYEFHGEKYDEVVKCAEKVIANLENTDEGELTTLQSNLYDAINNMLNRQIPKPSVDDAAKVAENEPVRQLEIEECTLRSIEPGKPSVNVQVKILGDNLDKPNSVYLIDGEGNRAPFNEITITNKQPSAINLTLNKCNIPSNFSPYEYSVALVLEFGNQEVRYDGIIVKQNKKS